MDTFCTPNPSMSSVFYTPPISTEKYRELLITQSRVIPQSQAIQMPDFLRLTPERQEDQLARVDIVSLLSKSFPHLVDSIFSHLSPTDLTSCLEVAKPWRNAVLSNNHFTGLINQYKMEKKKEQENLIKRDLLSNVPPQTPRLPFSALSNISIRPIAQTPLRSTFQTEIQNDAGIKCRPCPQCSSPAKILTDTVSQCFKCHYEFCPNCFKPSHADKGNCTISSSPPRKRQDVIACNRKSKKRLRRL